MSLSPLLAASDASSAWPLSDSGDAAGDVPARDFSDSAREAPAGPVFGAGEASPESADAAGRSLFALRGLFRR